MSPETGNPEPPALAALRGRFADAIRGVEHCREQYRVLVDRAAVVDVLRFLRDDPAHAFTFLADLTAIDDSPQTPRFRVVYVLRSMRDHREIVVQCGVPEDDCRTATVSHLFATADWLERECFDMFGIRFDGHPDLRRILMPDVFEDFPLRKDFPMQGRTSDQQWAEWVIARAQRPEGAPDEGFGA